MKVKSEPLLRRINGRSSKQTTQIKTKRHGEFIQFRKKPKQFQINFSSINKKKEKTNNPLYSQESLAKYFNLPSTKISLTMNYLNKTQSVLNAKKIEGLKQIQIFNSLQQKMRIYQRIGCQNLKKKFEIFEQASQMYWGHFDKVKDSCMFKESEEYPEVNLKIERNLMDKQKKSKRTKYKTDKVFRERQKQRVYTQTVRDYLEKDEEWRRYGYSLDNEDDQKLVMQSLERRNKSLQERARKYNKKYKSPELNQNHIDKDIITYSRFYMNKLNKTEN